MSSDVCKTLSALAPNVGSWGFLIHGREVDSMEKFLITLHVVAWFGAGLVIVFVLFGE